ncbi:MAG TPA: hypothetical protein DCY57_02935, partial [Bacteroidetes bacterium]|nr:hypothetical protein [Bacteroidota bacterium]
MNDNVRPFLPPALTKAVEQFETLPSLDTFLVVLSELSKRPGRDPSPDKLWQSFKDKIEATHPLKTIWEWCAMHDFSETVTVELSPEHEWLLYHKELYYEANKDSQDRMAAMSDKHIKALMAIDQTQEDYRGSALTSPENCYGPNLCAFELRSLLESVYPEKETDPALYIHDFFEAIFVQEVDDRSLFKIPPSTKASIRQKESHWKHLATRLKVEHEGVADFVLDSLIPWACENEKTHSGNFSEEQLECLEIVAKSLAVASIGALPWLPLREMQTINNWPQMKAAEVQSRFGVHGWTNNPSPAMLLVLSAELGRIIKFLPSLGDRAFRGVCECLIQLCTWLVEEEWHLFQLSGRWLTDLREDAPIRDDTDYELPDYMLACTWNLGEFMEQMLRSSRLGSRLTVSLMWDFFNLVTLEDEDDYVGGLGQTFRFVELGEEGYDYTPDDLHQSIKHLFLEMARMRRQGAPDPLRKTSREEWATLGTRARQYLSAIGETATTTMDPRMTFSFEEGDSGFLQDFEHPRVFNTLTDSFTRKNGWEVTQDMIQMYRLAESEGWYELGVSILAFYLISQSVRLGGRVSTDWSDLTPMIQKAMAYPTADCLFKAVRFAHDYCKEVGGANTVDVLAMRHWLPQITDDEQVVRAASRQSNIEDRKWYNLAPSQAKIHETEPFVLRIAEKVGSGTVKRDQIAKEVGTK